MAMFGALAKKRGLFDPPETYSTPGIGDDLPGAKPMGDPGMGGFTPAVAPPEKQGVNWMGVLSDALAGAIGQPGQYAAGRREDRQYERKLSLYQQQRRDGLEDFATKQQIEAKYAKPGALPDVIQLQTIADDPAQPPNIRKAALDRVTALNDPIVNANVGGRDYFGPRSTLLNNLGGGGDPAISPPPGASPPPASAAEPGQHLTVDQYRMMKQSMGNGYQGWAAKHGAAVLVNSPEEMAALPAGTPVVSPDGRRGVKR